MNNYKRAIISLIAVAAVIAVFIAVGLHTSSNEKAKNSTSVQQTSKPLKVETKVSDETKEEKQEVKTKKEEDKAKKQDNEKSDEKKSQEVKKSDTKVNEKEKNKDKSASENKKQSDNNDTGKQKKEENPSDKSDDSKEKSEVKTSSDSSDKSSSDSANKGSDEKTPEPDKGKEESKDNKSDQAYDVVTSVPFGDAELPIIECGLSSRNSVTISGDCVDLFDKSLNYMVSPKTEKYIEVKNFWDGKYVKASDGIYKVSCTVSAVNSEYNNYSTTKILHDLNESVPLPSEKHYTKYLSGNYNDTLIIHVELNMNLTKVS